MTRWCYLVTLVFTVLHLGGCIATPTVSVGNGSYDLVKKDFAVKHEKLARGYETRGSLKRALDEWLAISAVLPSASEPQVEIDRLKKIIAGRVAKHEKAAKAALAKSSYSEARIRFLKILALQPDNPKAIRALKKIEITTGYANLARAPKVSREVEQAYTAPAANSQSYTGITPAYVKRSPGPATGLPANQDSADGSGNAENLELALGYLSRKQYDTALEYFLLAREKKEASANVLDKHIAYTRTVLAELHYGRGVKAFRSAGYAIAIAEFEKALEYDPQHQKARLYLKSTSELQSRLKPE